RTSSLLFPPPAPPEIMETKKFDVCVIGTGPGGEGAAMKAAKEDKSVLVIEKQDLVGGNCTHVGTIPSKSLRFMVRQFLNFKLSPLFSDVARFEKISFPDLLRNAAGVISKQVNLRQGFYDRNRVQLVHGHARFVDSQTIVVDQDKG